MKKRWLGNTGLNNQYVQYVIRSISHWFIANQENSTTYLSMNLAFQEPQRQVCWHWSWAPQPSSLPPLLLKISHSASPPQSDISAEENKVTMTSSLTVMKSRCSAFEELKAALHPPAAVHHWPPSWPWGPPGPQQWWCPPGAAGSAGRQPSPAPRASPASPPPAGRHWPSLEQHWSHWWSVGGWSLVMREVMARYAHSVIGTFTAKSSFTEARAHG